MIAPPVEEAAPASVSAGEAVEVVEITMSPLEARALTVSAEASFSVKAPTVPLAETAPMALAPVRKIAPAPLSARTPAVTTPAPLSVAPAAT